MKILYFVLVFFSGNIIFAQSSRIHIPIDRSGFETIAIDSGTMRIYYALNALDIKDEKTFDDLRRLDIGSKSSKCYSYFFFKNDSLRNEFLKKNPKAQGIPISPSERGKKGEYWSLLIWSDFYNDFSKNVLTEFANMPRGGIPHYQYTEELPLQEWKILDETMTIAGHLCRKATCRFRGRDFTAWFTPDIPVSNGPWKFGGLPGLILKVYDSDKFYTFECIKIETYDKKFPIIQHDSKRYQDTERIKLRQVDKAIYEDYYTLTGMRARGKDFETTGIFEKFVPLPYHPLELE